MLPCRRPPLAERRFTSPAVEARLARASARLRDPELAWLLCNCYPNTLDTTVFVGEHAGKPDTYVITGDIDALWLRDSSAQVWPYLALLKEDPALERLVAGLIHRHARCVALDPYANAFYRDPARVSKWAADRTDIRPGMHERKWELDSLCYVVRLAHGYWRAGGDPAIFDADWLAAMRLLVATMREQQRRAGAGPYTFQRHTWRSTETCPDEGRGNAVRPVGLVATHFRPSDDATIFPYLVPANFFAVVSLRQLAALVSSRFPAETAFVAECLALADEIRAALLAHAVVKHPEHGEILAFEIDGFGSTYLADDANVPSLLSLPYLEALDPADRDLYRRTRRFLLTEDAHPFFARGSAAEGISSPHVARDMIWPMGIIVRALTSEDDAEIAACIHWLKTTHAGTGFMHESFHQDDPARFTRAWFAWANTLFGELILKVLDERPHLVT